MQDLKVTIIQSDLVWENPEQNLASFSEKIDAIKEETDLIVLPEMFTTAFTMNAKDLAETDNGQTLQWMINKAKDKKTDLIGSLIIKEDNSYFNRLYWVKSDGKFEHYDKRHLFRMAGEHNIYSPGKNKIINTTKGWRILPLICYDLRFPVWSRGKNDFDLIVFIANWPERRSSHWRLLLKARAVENQAYAIGVNRVGKDGLDIEYRGDSAVIDPLGKVLKQESHIEFIHTETLPWKKLDDYRNKFPVWKDADSFKIDE
ncbi:MAG: amidohydrolase [Calditrichaeota bacterium]|nr:MAG: amidohydrolase [Calditrichota bacterium]MBL1205061.1 amidohydrolase [Calditrichota bacterium]NOG44891.1 amidohydrolase [Calditrichota bacterium]